MSGARWRGRAVVPLAGCLVCTLPMAWAQDGGALAPVVIRGSASESRGWLGSATVDVVDGQTIREGQLQINLSEGLGRVPGLVIRNRENYAQDLQVSIRGYGSRATFGVRGVRLFVDGIPASAPDGSGQAANFPLGSAERIEVVRGPFAAMYGASSGGAILLYTQDGARPAEWRTGLAAGADGLWRLSTQLSGQTGTAEAPGWSYLLDTGRFETDGQRPQSAAHRSTTNAKLSRAHEGGRTTLVFNRQTGFSQDPLGLTRSQFNADPGQTDASATSFNTRKSLSQTQAGLAWDHALGGGHGLELMGYVGQRRVVQFQAIPTGAQAAPGSAGGVIDLDREYWGFNARWRLQRDWQGGRLDLSAGLAMDRQIDQRLGFNNFVGGQVGVLGSLRRDESNSARSLDPYLRASWTRSDWTFDAGVRHVHTEFESSDRFLSNGNDSGATRYSGTLPVIGARWQLHPGLQLFGSVGRGLEIPTLNEAAYRSTGSGAGLNTALNAARSTSAELGLRGRHGSGLWNATLFQIDTRDEIVVQNNTGGRSSFQNAGRTERQGLELAADAAIGEFTLTGAYTAMRARYRDGFLSCTSSPCPNVNAPTAIPAGARLPGLPAQQLFAQVAWAPRWGAAAGAVFSLEARHSGRVYVNDLNTDAAESHTLFALAARFEQQRGAWTWRQFLRLDNVTDRRHAGSVIVNEGNGRFFEPGAGRALSAGLEFTRRF